MKPDISLYGIVDPQVGRGRSLSEIAGLAAQAGMTLLQYRAKELDTRAMIAQARTLKSALSGSGVPLLINDRIDVALAAGADGVHIGREDMTPHDARKLLGPGAIIGATVKAATDIDDLVGAPVDYICIGGVFATRHKDNRDPPLGVTAFGALADYARSRLGPMPVGAIAGIDAENAGSLIRAGADGVAVIGALFSGNDVVSATRLMSEVIRKARS